MVRSLSVGRRGSRVSKSSKARCRWYTIGVSEREVKNELPEVLVSEADRDGEVGWEANSGCDVKMDGGAESGGDLKDRVENDETRVERSGDVCVVGSSELPRDMVATDEDLARVSDDRADVIRGGPPGLIDIGILLKEMRLAALVFLLCLATIDSFPLFVGNGIGARGGLDEADMRSEMLL